MACLQGKVAVVTGAASGLGKAIVERFSKEGAAIVVADINEDLGRDVAASIASSHFIKVDVTDPASVEQLVRSSVEHYGQIDILVNNAGIEGELSPTIDSSLENWHKVIAVNLDGVYFGIKYGVAAMLANRNGGVVLNMSSIVGLVGFGNLPPYSASKAGVIQLSRAAAIEYAAQRIRVNAICPTVVRTPLLERVIENSPDPKQTRERMENMNPLPGLPTPDDVAAAALFLASDEAKFITGIALPIDGGYTAR